MNTVLKDSEFVAPSADRCLIHFNRLYAILYKTLHILVVDVSDGPEWVLAPLPLGINEARSKSHAHRNVIEVLNRHVV